MKIPTTISLEPKLLQELDSYVANNGHGSISELIEDLVRSFLGKAKGTNGDDQELELINRNADRLNQEAEDVLTYQVDL